jgi:hypothetical protein
VADCLTANPPYSFTLQDDLGDRQQQSFTFLVGIPVTKILVMVALVLLLVIGVVGVKSFKKRG